MKENGQIGSLRNFKKEDGNILFTSLLLLLAMNFLALALVQTAQREYQTADFKTIDSSTFNLAESCVQDVVRWLKGHNRAPTALPHTITRNDISHLYRTGESQDNRNRLTGYAYNCATSQITVRSVTGGTLGQGENIGNNTGYGAGGDLRPHYYYEIEANSTGPKNSSRRIITTVAVQY